MVVDQTAVVEALGELRAVQAPFGLAGRVLVDIGLADAAFPVETPVGPAFVAFNEQGISMVEKADSFEEFGRVYERRFGRRVVPASAERLRRAVERRLAGQSEELSFDLSGCTEFERAVLLKTLEIPRGEIRPYAWVARAIGRPGAVRAVGSALARNPIPLLIPCHRVVRSDGTIGQYGMGGPAAKHALLTIEGALLPG